MTRTTEQFYETHITPRLSVLAFIVHNEIKKGNIRTLAVIPSSKYTFGSYAVEECWSQLNDAIKKIAGEAYEKVFPPEFKEGRELNRLDLIDLIVQNLEDKELINLEW